MRRQLKTNKVGGGDYTGVGERMLSFREDHPNSKILTSFTEKEDGEITFKTYIWKDKKVFMDWITKGNKEMALLTADSEASSRGPSKGKKEFEKQETIATGRALAYLGYSGNGQIASSEEMEDFLSYKDEKNEEDVLSAIEYVSESQTVEELMKRYLELGMDIRNNSRIKDKCKEIKIAILEKLKINEVS